ncbi:MAG: FliG C-terminal domain-containing protein [Elusimicrobiota bacterium]|jgi:flagellar motor switch protein FliG
MKKLPLLLALCAALGAPGASAAPANTPSDEIGAKVQLEGSIEKRLEAVLRKAFNREDIIVIANVDMVSETEKDEASDEEIMPGVPPKVTPATPGPLGVTLTKVRRVLATVLVDESATAEDLALIRKTAEGLLGIVPERGDALAVEKIRFRKAPPISAADFLKPSGLLSLLWLLLAAAGLLGLQRGTVALVAVGREWIASSRSAAEKSERRLDAEAPEAAAAEAAAAAAADIDEEDRSALPFGFISEKDLPTLILLLQKAKAQTCAVVVHYLPGALAAQVLEALSPERRREVVALMCRVTQLDREQVRVVEESLRARIHYLMGGEHKLAELLDHAPEALREEMLGTLRERDPELGARLKRRIVLLEDLGALEEADLKALVRRIPLRSLAIVLRSAEDLKARILPKLRSGIGEWLTQEIELTQVPPKELAEAERRRVLVALRALVREGRVTLRRES